MVVDPKVVQTPADVSPTTDCERVAISSLVKVSTRGSCRNFIGISYIAPTAEESDR